MGKQLNSVDWGKLIHKYGQDLVTKIKTHLESGSSHEINPKLYEQKSSDAKIVIQLLEHLTEIGLLTLKIIKICPTPGCKNILDDEIATCSKCEVDYRETGDEPTTQTRYKINFEEKSRDVPWLISVHGMNTDGRWQEEFSWRIANKFWYHAPVLIFKYGIVRYGVLFPYFHRKYTKLLGERITTAIDHARQSGINEPPDMIVHSFGSLLFSYLLAHEDFNHLRFGRVIVCGGIVNPNFNWSHFIDTNKIQAVLIHCSKKDHTVKFAQYTIPNSGPTGAFGSSDPKVINVLEETYGHSSYFEPTILASNLQTGGTWDIFLKYPLGHIGCVLPVNQQSVHWMPQNSVIRLLTRVILIVLPFYLTFIVIGLFYKLFK